MSWFKHSDSLSWSPGHLGKGYLLHDGMIKSWNVDPYNPVDQTQVHQLARETSPIALRFEIDPDGGVITDNPGSNVDAILAEDPHLYDAGQRPEFEDDWNLDHFTPKPDPPGPDYNFIMSREAPLPINMNQGCPRCHQGTIDPEAGDCDRCGYVIPWDGAETNNGYDSLWENLRPVDQDPALLVPEGEWGERHFGAWEWHESKFHTTGHYNRWTGQRCHCGWGGRGKTRRELRESRIVTSDDLHMRKLRKAPDKAFQTEAGQKFLEHLATDIPDEYDSLRPYLAHRFKKGDVRFNEAPRGPAHWRFNPETGQRERQEGDLLSPRLEYLAKHHPIETYHNHEPLPLSQPDWRLLTSQIPKWHQWYEARQHPLRRGVNVMDKHFDPDTLELRAAQHAKAVEEARKKENWLEEYAQPNAYYDPPGPIHVFGPEAGPYKGWQVHKLDAHQAEGDSEALGHCIGSDEQPYKDAIDRGDIDAYSLRDKEGYPKVSWHINPSGDSIGHMQGKSGDPKPEYRNLISMFNNHHGLPDEETYEEQIPDGYDNYFTFPAATDMEDYLRWHGPETDYEYAYDNGNIGDDTEFQNEDPEWDRIARDYLNTPSADDDEFHSALRDNSFGHHGGPSTQFGHEADMANALREEADPTDPDHARRLHTWNDNVRYHGNAIDVPEPQTNEVDKYNEAMDEHGSAEPDDWDALAQDYLTYPQYYGPYERDGEQAVTRPNGYDPYHDPTDPNDGSNNPRRLGEPGYYQPSTEYDKFHRHLRDNWHHDQMAEALKRNVDWEDPDHQLAMQSWNEGMPKQNIHPPEPEVEGPPVGQMQWNWPDQWQWPQNRRPSDPTPRTMEQSQGTNDYWDWNAVPQYQVSNDSRYIPRASSWHWADQRGWTHMYHVSPRKNRESILEHGLQGADMDSPWDQEEYREHAQPPGNYLFDNPEDAEDYAWATQGRNWAGGYPKDDSAGWEDRYEQDDPPEDFHEWEPDAQDEWYDNAEWRERTEDPNGWDIYRVDTRGLPLHRDPETSLVGEQKGRNQWSPQSLQKSFQNLQDAGNAWYDEDADPWQQQLAESGGYYGTEPRRYYIPNDIEPERIQLHQHLPAWGMTENNYMDRIDDSDSQNEVPTVWGEMNVRRPQFPSHSRREVEPRRPFGRSSSELSPVTELREWLADLGGAEEPPSIHYDSPEDIVAEAPSTAREGLPYIPPSEVANYTEKGSKRLRTAERVCQHCGKPERPDFGNYDPVYGFLCRFCHKPLGIFAPGHEPKEVPVQPVDTPIQADDIPDTFPDHWSSLRIADSPITQADATNDPLGKAPALEPSRSGDPDYLKAEICPHCLQRHRPDQPCGESAVTQYQQQERAWYNRDPNAIHTPDTSTRASAADRPRSRHRPSR